MRFVTALICGAVALGPSLVHAQAAPQRQPPVTSPAATPAAAPAAPAPATAPATPAETATQTPPPTSTPAAESGAATPAAASESSEDPAPAVHFHGTAEAFYSYNFNDPSNGMTAWRFYDFRHNMLGLQGALLSTEWNAGPVRGRVQLQFGALTELFWDAGRGLDLDLLWRLLQEVTIEWTTPYRRLSFEAGLFNVPFGPEYNMAYLNWNWSTSNLFAMMPYQIAGARANFNLGRGWTARAGVYNGWDQIVTDTNAGKSVLVSIEWEHPDDEDTFFTFNYMVGDERATGDARGPFVRHTFDVYGQWHFLERFYLRGHVFSGFEPTMGTTIDGWLGAALFAKVDIVPWFSVAARGDVVRTFSGETGENLFHADTLEATGLMRNTSTLLGSATLTADLHPGSHFSFRLEGRHDRADFPLFYGGMVTRTMMGADIPNRTNQTTLTAGMTAWF